MMHEIRSDPGDYGQYNFYVCAFLGEKEVKILPSPSPAEQIKGYSYEYECALFGNPSFCICLRVSFEEDAFRNELARLTELCPTVRSDDGQTVFWRRGSPDDYRGLKDDRILEGNSCLFESARSDSEACTIDYLVAEQWEPARIPDCVEAYFASIQETSSP
ncbi:MAG: hypothetical protein II719_05675 [Clostridia bacterium]|nr:hypothetical protein [Clostridia bacterium]